MKPAERIADRLMDNLIKIVWQLIMHLSNYKLGVDRITPASWVKVHSRMISRIDKGSPELKGEKVFMGCLMKLKCRAEEEVCGEEYLSEVGAGRIEGDYPLYDVGKKYEQ